MEDHERTDRLKTIPVEYASGSNPEARALTAADLNGSQFNDPLREHIETLDAQATGNRQAAQRLLGLEGASVFDDLSTGEIEKANPLAARSKVKADNLTAAAESIQTQVIENRPPAALVEIAARMQGWHGYQFRLEAETNAPAGTKGWSAVGVNEISETEDAEISLQYIDDPAADYEAVVVETAVYGVEKPPEATPDEHSSAVVVSGAPRQRDWMVAHETLQKAVINGQQGRPAPAEESLALAQQTIHALYEQPQQTQLQPAPVQSIDVGPELS